MKITHTPVLPNLGITMGDPSGVGPEIISKALSDPEIYKICRPVVLGDLHAMTDAHRSHDEGSLHAVSEPSKAKAKPGCIDIIGLSSLERHFITPGKPTVEGGKAMVAFILEAVKLTMLGHLDAMVTCPISKILMHEAGFRVEGHTQLIAQRLQGFDDFRTQERIRQLIDPGQLLVRRGQGLSSTGIQERGNRRERARDLVAMLEPAYALIGGPEPFSQSDLVSARGL